MSNLSDNYEKIFDKLYKSGVYHLHINFDSLSANEKHFAFEVTRRFLDICRLLNKHWPNTSRYISAVHGDEIFEAIYAHIFDSSENTGSLVDAVYSSVRLVLNEKDDMASIFLLNFERETGKGEGIQFVYDALQSDHRSKMVFCADFDFLNFYHTVDYYRRTSAPAVLFRNIKMIKRDTYAIYNT